MSALYEELKVSSIFLETEVPKFFMIDPSKIISTHYKVEICGQV